MHHLTSHFETGNSGTSDNRLERYTDEERDLALCRAICDAAGGAVVAHETIEAYHEAEEEEDGERWDGQS